MIPDACLTLRYRSKVNGTCSPLHLCVVAIEKGAFRSPLTTVGQLTCVFRRYATRLYSGRRQKEYVHLVEVVNVCQVINEEILQRTSYHNKRYCSKQSWT